MLDVVGMACTHLDDGQFRLGSYLQQGKRNANVIVEIALRRGHPVLGGKDGADQFLGGGLAVGASQAKNRQMIVSQTVAAMMARQRPQRVEAVGDGDDAGIAAGCRGAAVVHDGARRARLQRFQRILVAVEIITLEGYEHLAPGNGPAVCRNATAAGLILLI